MAQYLAEVYRSPWAEIQELIPEIVMRWGKVCIANGGDKIRSSSAISLSQSILTRDSSYVRVSTSIS